MGRYTYYRPGWTHKVWASIPLNHPSGIFNRKRTKKFLNFERRGLDRYDMPEGVIRDYIGRYAVRRLARKRVLPSIKQFRRRKEGLKFFNFLDKNTNHAMGNHDWYKELMSSV